LLPTPGVAPGSMEARMSIASLAASSAVAATATSSLHAGAGRQPFAVALGRSPRAHHSRAADGTAAGGGDGTPKRTLADDSRALFGDVFGALGAETPSHATAERAVRAYGQVAAAV
jgi:hypothetical protein